LIDEKKSGLSYANRLLLLSGTPKKLHALVKEINRLLEEKEARLKQQRHEPAS
jgi:hypothetical protein